MKNISVTRGERRGFALLTVILLTLAMAALAASAIYMSGNAQLIGTSVDREREFKYGAEAAMAIGKSRLNTDPLVLPDTGYVTLMSGQQLTAADGTMVPGLTVNLYAGPSGSASGQFGRFASVVAEARDGQGARFVRRLELTQESFARFAYWSDKETNNGSVIYFANQDNLWGPVWSNDQINIASSGAHFHNDVGTAKTVSGKNYGTFDKQLLENQPPIVLPSNTTLSKLTGYAAAGSMNFAGTTGTVTSTVRVRLEFVAINLSAPPDSTGVDEGFVKVYVGNNDMSDWVRGDWTDTKAAARNCGASFPITLNGPAVFFPASVFTKGWFAQALMNGGMSANNANNMSGASLNTIMAQPTARCYLGGDNHLVAEERDSTNFAANVKQIGGTDATFTPNGKHGRWLQYPGPIDPRVVGRPDGAYLFPLYRGLNPGTKGVITAAGSIGVSGVVRGNVTLYATGNVLILDDLRYATDPSVGTCVDMLGIISANNITVADNALNDPPDVNFGANNYKNLDDTKDLYIHGIMMALNTSFGVEKWDSGPSNANDCEGTNGGRGCLYLYGGLIQQQRGAVGLVSGQGYIKRYSYDRCAISKPPPYFPTTGRFLDNRYYEIDPVRFDVKKLFAGLVPN